MAMILPGILRFKVGLISPDCKEDGVLGTGEGRFLVGRVAARDFFKLAAATGELGSGWLFF
jgi:hypothetical protein